MRRELIGLRAATADLETVVITMNGATLAGATSFVDVLDEFRGQSVEQHDTEGAEPCTIGYTSGTTGRPKGAVQSHQAVYLNCAHTATMHGRTADDVIVTALPAPHVYGNVVINSTFLTGGTVVLMNRFNAEAALGLIAKERSDRVRGCSDDVCAAARLRGARDHGLEFAALVHGGAKPCRSRPSNAGSESVARLCWSCGG